MKRLPLLTTSASTCYRTCPRQFFFQYEELYRPAFEDDTKRFGTLGHHGCEAWWIAKGARPHAPGSWLSDALAAIEEHRYGDPFEHAKSVVLMLAYHARWALSPLVPLAVERQYRTPLINPATGAASRTWEHGGKIDVIVTDPTGTELPEGELYLLDHKYTSEDWGPGSDYRTRLSLGSQISNYIHGARAIGFNVRGWIHDVIKKPGQRPLRATAEVKMTQEKRAKDGTLKEPSRPRAGQRLVDETPEEYMERIAADIAEDPNKYFGHIGPVVRMEEESREAAFDLWQTGVQIRESRAANMWPRNVASCKQYGKPCPFVPVCTGQASLDDATRYRRASRQHEELEEEAEEQRKEGEAA